MNICIFRWNGITFDLEKALIKKGHKVFAAKMIKQSDLKKFDVLVSWNETQPSGGRDYVKYCKNQGIKTILLQHGRWGTSRVFPPFNEEILSDKYCVWGEGDRKRMLEIGTPEEKLVVTGTPIFKHLTGTVKHEGTNIVFSPEHWDTEVVENQIVAGVLRKLRGVKIYTKILLGEHYEDIYDNPVKSHREQSNHLDIVSNLLEKADLVVGISESTLELMAEILDIPVVIADIWIPKACGGDERYKVYNRLYSNACKRVKDITKLNEVIYQQLKHPEELREERFVVSREDGGVDIPKPVDRIIEVIENV